jgi:hypothetical protein
MKPELVLSRRAALRLLAVCNQGERSVDAVLHPSQGNWQALRDYYAADMMARVQAALADLDVPDGASLPDRLPSTDYGFLGYRLPLVQYLGNKFRRSWRLPAVVQSFLAGALARLLRCLECEQQPGNEELVRLRLDLSAAASYLDNRLVGLPELPVLRDVEYYAPPTGKRLHPIHEALKPRKPR